MKDFVGRDIRVGDTVVYFNYKANADALKVAKVIGFTEQRVRIEIRLTEKRTKQMTAIPERVVRIRRGRK